MFMRSWATIIIAITVYILQMFLFASEHDGATFWRYKTKGRSAFSKFYSVCVPVNKTQNDVSAVEHKSKLKEKWGIFWLVDAFQQCAMK